ncbi:hypothetical protein K443DRAFT_402971 [Laccaria amethystina LaAM-08-1]|uniref:Uncharacterized protein n=1 Tax=Laccaria amethystina LaAM-08-1 TaxID=1095629 RepID=A0A0C9X6K8_9AGAR|nr:hypothetical protein K443DRAFT_402971 [Laccaria amethystina LaAM-08-1]
MQSPLKQCQLRLFVSGMVHSLCVHSHKPKTLTLDKIRHGSWRTILSHSPSRQAWRRPTCCSLSLPALADIGKPPLTASHLRARGVLSRVPDKSLKSI